MIGVDETETVTDSITVMYMPPPRGARPGSRVCGVLPTTGHLDATRDVALEVFLSDSVQSSSPSTSVRVLAASALVHHTSAPFVPFLISSDQWIGMRVDGADVTEPLRFLDAG